MTISEVLHNELNTLRAENAALKEQVAQLKAIISEEAKDSGNVILELTTLQYKAAALVDALNVMENGAEECMDFDECTAMLVPMDNWHGVFEVLAAFKGEK